MGNRHAFIYAVCLALLGVTLSHMFLCFSVRISIVKNSHVSIVINDNIRVMVLLHRVWKKHPVNVDFLGVYIDNDNQYSSLVHGLIGTTIVNSFQTMKRTLKPILKLLRRVSDVFCRHL